MAAIKKVTSSESLLELLDHAASYNEVQDTNSNGWLFSNPSQEAQDLIQAHFEEKFLREYASHYRRDCHTFELTDSLPFMKDAMQTLIDDDFTKCFESASDRPWNWNVYLFPAWVLGVVLRYAILFPLRLFCLTTLGPLCILAFFCAQAFIRNKQRRHHWQKFFIRLLCTVFVMSWSGVVHYHGHVPEKAPNQVYVANHSTIMDVAILMQRGKIFALVGQKHPGFVGFLQTKILACLDSIWFERGQSKDRRAVARTVKEHITNPDNNSLLLFPEGVCVNNDYCVMFKKGAFELDATVIPVAIKYNKTFSDPFFNSRQQSFFKHLFTLMSGWAVVCDVWFLEPQTQAANESPAQFANRVKAMIAERAGLKNVPWDGYLKYFRPSARFKAHQQKVFAQSLLLRFKNYQHRVKKERITRSRNNSTVAKKKRGGGLAAALAASSSGSSDGADGENGANLSLAWSQKSQRDGGGSGSGGESNDDGGSANGDGSGGKRGVSSFAESRGLAGQAVDTTGPAAGASSDAYSDSLTPTPRRPHDPTKFVIQPNAVDEIIKRQFSEKFSSHHQDWDVNDDTSDNAGGSPVWATPPLAPADIPDDLGLPSTAGGVGADGPVVRRRVPKMDA